MELRARCERRRLRRPFRIARGAVDAVDLVVVELRRGSLRGRGEARPYRRFGEPPRRVLSDLERAASRIAAGVPDDEVIAGLSTFAARSAFDAARLELYARAAGLSVSALLGLRAPREVVSLRTVGVEDSPERAAALARRLGAAGPIKVKIAGAEGVASVAAVRRALPEARLLVDANEGVSPRRVRGVLERLAELGVEAVEQPVAARHDHVLAGERPLPVIADEAYAAGIEAAGLADRYDGVNVKLDKAGGVTAALRRLRGIRRAGLRILLGCMVSTSLSIAPAFLLAPFADWIDLDGPLWLRRDRAGGARATATGRLRAPRLWPLLPPARHLSACARVG